MPEDPQLTALIKLLRSGCRALAYAHIPDKQLAAGIDYENRRLAGRSRLVSLSYDFDNYDGGGWLFYWLEALTSPSDVRGFCHGHAQMVIADLDARYASARQRSLCEVNPADASRLQRPWELAYAFRYDLPEYWRSWTLEYYELGIDPAHPISAALVQTFLENGGTTQLMGHLAWAEANHQRAQLVHRPRGLTSG